MASFKQGDRAWLSLDGFKTRHAVTIVEDHKGEDYLVKFVLGDSGVVQYVGSGDLELMSALDRLAYEAQ